MYTLRPISERSLFEVVNSKFVKGADKLRFKEWKFFFSLSLSVSLSFSFSLSAIFLQIWIQIYTTETLIKKNIWQINLPAISIWKVLLDTK